MLKHWVEEIFQRYNLLKTFSEQSALTLWPTVVGERIAQLTQAERLSNGILYIVVSSSAVAQELSFLKSRYLDALNEQLEKGSHIEEIRFIPGHFRRVKISQLVPTSPTVEHEKAQRLFTHVKDPILRASFERLYLTLRRREEQLLAKGGKRCPSCGTVFRDAGGRCPGCQFDYVEGKAVKD